MTTFTTILNIPSAVISSASPIVRHISFDIQDSLVLYSDRLKAIPYQYNNRLLFPKFVIKRINSTIKDTAMMKYLEKLEDFVIRALVVMMALVVFFATIDLCWIIIQTLIVPPYLLFDVGRLLEIFGVFLLVLIGIELLESIRTYLDKKIIHVEVVMTVALIAVARKVIILDVKELDGLKLIGIGIIIVALAFGYVYIKRCYRDGTICEPEPRRE
jgi:uncharacterized membrane protein (DUF373 family)